MDKHSTAAAPSSCCDDYDSASLTCDEALRRILAFVGAITGEERIHLRAGLGRVLARPIVSPINVPAHTNSAMDGYALCGRALPQSGTIHLQVIGTAFAGKPFTGLAADTQCVRVMTGAVMPAGTDTVVMQEQANLIGDAITIHAGHKPGQHVRQAGEDIAQNQLVLEPGQRLTPADLGLIASLGIGEISVVRRLRVAFFSTGDELRSIGEPAATGDIFDSNRYTLFGMLARLGVDVIDMGIVRDTRDEIRGALRQAAACADVVITSGGVSVGEADYIKEILHEIGAVHFWKVAMKPGRPLACGRIGDAIFFGLPGNPVSVMVTFYQFVQPALLAMMGASEPVMVLARARVTQSLKKRPGRTEFQRAKLARGSGGELEVTPTGDQGSGILRSMSIANCFIVLAMDCGNVEPGEFVDVQPFFGLV